MQLVLSLFPGIGLLDMAFEEEGFCVVRGPDLLWGGDVRRFHPPAGRFDGVIGGPPCQAFSPLANVCRTRYGAGSVAANLIPEYERVVCEADPEWFVMENVERAPLPSVAGYCVRDILVNNRWFGEKQNRVRRFSFGSRSGVALHPQFAPLEPFGWEPAVCASVGGRRAKPILDGDGRPVGNQSKARLGLRLKTAADMAALQGLPADFLAESPLTSDGKRQAIGNGVPLPMGRAIAKAVKRALEQTAPLEVTA